MQGRRLVPTDDFAEELGEGDCRVVLVEWADDLHAHRQPRGRAADRALTAGRPANEAGAIQNDWLV